MPLTYTPQADDILAFTVDFDRFDCEDFWGGHGRWQYKCTFTYDGETLDAGVIWSGTTTRDNPERLGEMLASLLVHFSAWIDRDCEDDAFPAECKPLAEMLDSGQVHLWADEVRRTL